MCTALALLTRASCPAAAPRSEHPQPTDPDVQPIFRTLLPPTPLAQITVTIVDVKNAARRRLLASVSVETLITVDSGSTAQEAAQALAAVTEVTTQMTEVRPLLLPCVVGQPCRLPAY